MHENKDIVIEAIDLPKMLEKLEEGFYAIPVFQREFVWDIGMGMSMEAGNHYNMVAQFKQGKIRILLFDDGNVYVPSNDQRRVPVPAHTKHCSDYFKTRQIVENKGIMKANYRYVRGYIDNNREFFKTLESELTKPIAPILKDDW